MSKKMVLEISQLRRDQICRYLLVVSILAFALYFSLYQIQAHRALWTGVDLTNLVQPIWNTLHGRFLRSTVYNPTGEYTVDYDGRVTESRLASHVQPLQLVLMLPYLVVPRAETLFVLLSTVVAWGAVPMYHIARRRLASPWLALLAAWIYLLWPAVQTNAAWEVHGVSFLPPFLLAALDAAERKQHGWWWFWMLLAMSCREDIPFLAGWAMLWLAPQEERSTALTMFGVGLGWSMLSFFVIIPYFGGEGSPFIAYFFPPGTDLTLSGIGNLVVRPQFWLVQMLHFIEYNVRLGLPLLFFYCLHRPSLLAMAPLLVLNGFGWHQAVRLPFFSHYSAPVVPWALVGTVEGAQILTRWLRRRRPGLKGRELIWSALLLTITLVSVVQGYLPFSRSAVWPRPLRSLTVVTSILEVVPGSAQLSANMHLAPHLARRETLRLFPDTRDVDWMALDVWNWADPYGPAVPVWEALLVDPTWETVVAEDGIAVLRRGDGPPEDLGMAFVPGESSSLPTLETYFGTAWMLTGAEVFPLPFGHFILCTDWQGIYQGSPVVPEIRLTADGRSQPLNSYRLLPSLYETPGMFRDCTQLQVATPGSGVTLWLSMVDTTGEPLQAYVSETAQSWEDRAYIDGTALRLEIAAW